jgi:hypothetical protein
MRFCFHPFSFLGRPRFLRKGPRIYWSRFDSWRHIPHHLCCPPPFSSPESRGTECTVRFPHLPPGDRSWGCWACCSPFFRISLGLNSPLSESCENCIPGLLDGFMGVSAYKKDKPLAIQLRLPIQQPSVLCMKPWVQSLIYLSSSLGILAILSFILRPTLTGHQAWRTSDVTVLLSESHKTPYPVLQGCDLDHPLSPYLQDNFAWRKLSWYWSEPPCRSLVH